MVQEGNDNSLASQQDHNSKRTWAYEGMLHFLQHILLHLSHSYDVSRYENFWKQNV